MAAYRILGSALISAALPCYAPVNSLFHSCKFPVLTSQGIGLKIVRKQCFDRCQSVRLALFRTNFPVNSHRTGKCNRLVRSWSRLWERASTASEKQARIRPVALARDLVVADLVAAGLLERQLPLRAGTVILIVSPDLPGKPVNIASTRFGTSFCRLSVRERALAFPSNSDALSALRRILRSSSLT